MSTIGVVSTSQKQKKAESAYAYITQSVMATPSTSQTPVKVFPFNTANKYQVYIIDDAVPPTQFPQHITHTPLPQTVKFNSIVANVIASLSASYFKHLLKQNDKSGTQTIDKWKVYLNLQQNHALVADCFWYSICKFFHRDKYPHSQSQLQKRIAKNYVGLFLSIKDKKQHGIFFKEYFNTLAQSVFYSFFYAFPKSTSRFHSVELKEQLLKMFSLLFTGVQISNKRAYYDKWTLDLGTGNILIKRGKKSQSVVQQLPEIHTNPIKTRLLQKMKKRQVLPIRYSPIMELYLRTNKYKTRNYISQFKMKYSRSDKNQQQKEQQFARYKEQAKRINEWSQAQKEDEEIKKQRLEAQIKALKRETINHHKRLDRRKAEELERGAHEYANYLVSMLNAGITMTSLGVVRKNFG